MQQTTMNSLTFNNSEVLLVFGPTLTWYWILCTVANRLLWYHNKLGTRGESQTYFGEKPTSSAGGVTLTNSCRDGRGCLSPSLERRLVMDGKVAACCFCVNFFLFGTFPNGLIWWGRFFSSKTTSFGFSFRVLTNFFNCQPTCQNIK